MDPSRPLHRWTSTYVFLAASIGAAIGLANIWKFTYVAGANGGGFFVLIYLATLFLVAVPALIAEMMIGQRGKRSVVGTMRVLRENHGISRYWEGYALMAIAGIYLVLSFYCVIAGWTIDYFVTSLSGSFAGLSSQSAEGLFNGMLGNPGRMVVYQALIILITATVVAMGLHRGVERVLGSLTPTLFVLIILLLLYSVFYADFAAGLAFLFRPDPATLNMELVLMASGQAFFSLGVGLGVMMTMGAYTGDEVSIARSAFIIGTADGVVAILSALAIFPIVFSYGLTPAQGPGLMFLTLPVAFGQMPGGAVLSPLFFLLLTFAALTSTIVIFETVIAWLEDITGRSRVFLSACFGGAVWLLGLATVFSFNIWSDFRPLSVIPVFADKNIFELLDYTASNIMMPLGGVLVCLLAAWALPGKVSMDGAGIRNPVLQQAWYALVRYVVPLFISVLFIVNLI